MRKLFDQVAMKTSTITTYKYSTSFSLGIKCLHKSLHNPICSIYGFVRFADEIVDTFHDAPQEKLLIKFRNDTYEAIEDGISLNPILHAFQDTVNKYNIERELIDTFLDSMEMDLGIKKYNSTNDLKNYILGSAEVVGLMCLRVFVHGDDEMFHKLKPFAMSLGSAFQKVNFLRDLRNDYVELGRSYFPGFNWETFDKGTKKQIEGDILNDFQMARKGIEQLPSSSKFGVLLAYKYYLALFKKIQRKPASQIKTERIRIPNPQKAAILCTTLISHRLNVNL